MKQNYIVIIVGIALFAMGCASDQKLKTPTDESGIREGGFRGLAWGSK